MSECDEVAGTLQERWQSFKKYLKGLGSDVTMDHARYLVRRWMPDESMQVIDNVAWSLYQNNKEGT